MIAKLRLKNWKSHQDSEFEFSKGVNALLGIMGSGKSSVMDALSFALFGTFPALNQRKVKLDEVIRNNPEQATRAEVILTVTDAEDKSYEIQRIVELGKGTIEANLRKDGELLEGPNPQRTNEYITRVLKADYDIFSRAIYSEQNELDAFLHIPKGQRMARIDKLLHIDRFENARKSTTTLINKLEAELSAKKNVAHQIFSPNDQEHLESARAEIKRLQEKIIVFEEKKKTARIEKENTEKSLEEFRHVQDQLTELETQKARVQGQLDQLQSTLKPEYDEYTPEKLQIQRTAVEVSRKNLELIDREFQELGKQKAGLESTESVLREELSGAVILLRTHNLDQLSTEEFAGRGIELLPQSAAEQEIANEFMNLKEHHVSKQSVQLEINQVVLELTDVERHLESHKATRAYSARLIEEIHESNECPVCMRNMDDIIKRTTEDNMNRKVSKIDLEQERVLLQLSELREKKTELELVLAKFESLENRLQEIITAKNQLFEKFTESIQKRDSLNAKLLVNSESLQKVNQSYAELESRLQDTDREKITHERERLELIARALESKATITKLSADQAKIQVDITAIGVDSNKLQELQKKLTEYASMVEKYAAQIEGSQGLIQEKNRQVSALELKEKELELHRDSLKKYEGSIEKMVLFQNALLKTQESLRSEFVTIVNGVMNKIWDTLYPYADLQAVKLEVEEGDYVLKVSTPVGWMNVEGRASGGERTIASLALRIAFSLALAPNLSWLVLDEPTHNLDSQAINELGNTLRERLPSLIDQIFLITHEERLESAVTGSLYRLDRDKEAGEASKAKLVVPSSTED